MKDLELNDELRSLPYKVRNGEMTLEAAKERTNAIKNELSDMAQRAAAVIAKPETRSTKMGFGDLSTAMIEKRAITLNGTGAINQVASIVEEIQAKTPLLNAVQYFYGPNASSQIPLMSPGLALPVVAAEGYTSGSTDTTAVLTTTAILPVPYISTLPVSFDALNFYSANLESKLSSMFAGVYATAMHKVIVDALFHTTGVASGNKIHLTASGLPTINALAELTYTLGDYTDTGLMVMNSAALRHALDSASDVSGRIYAEEIQRSKTLNGVKIITTSFAPTAVTDGVLVVVAGDMANFGLGVAADLMITPKTKVGDNNTYYDACMYFAGKVIQNKNLFGITAHA